MSVFLSLSANDACCTHLNIDTFPFYTLKLLKPDFTSLSLSFWLAFSLLVSFSLSLSAVRGVCLAAGFCLFIVSRWQTQTSFVWLSSSQRAFYCLGSSAYPVSSSQALWWALLYVATGNNCHYQSTSLEMGRKPGETFLLIMGTSSLPGEQWNVRWGQCFGFFLRGQNFLVS